MNNIIKITKSSRSNVSNVDFDNIPFGRTFSDHMFEADYINGEWTNFEIKPFDRISIHPANLALHYGQSIFEGMKASLSINGDPLFFRPEQHSIRMNASARRMCMPEFPQEVFLDAIHKLVAIEKEWIPKKKGSALYIRPFMFANGEFIGVKESDTYKFIIFTGPVGPYYAKPVSLIAEEHYVRAAVGGVGEAKAAGNYAASLLPARLAKEKGYDQILWLDAVEHKYVQEVGTMNIFFVIDGKVLTPKTDGAILKGITRKTVLQLLEDKGIETIEELIDINDIVEAHKAGLLQEVFGTGTAAVVSHVSKIMYRDTLIELPPVENRKVGPMIKETIDGLRAGTIEDRHNWIVPVKQLVNV